MTLWIDLNFTLALFLLIVNDYIIIVLLKTYQTVSLLKKIEY